MKQIVEEAANEYCRKHIANPEGLVTSLVKGFIAGAEWQLQQLGHPDPPGEQGADGTTTIKEVMKEKAIEAFNEDMNLLCKIFGHSYRTCGGIVYCIRCARIPESHKRYKAIKPPVKI